MGTLSGTNIVWACATTGVSYAGTAANVTVTGEDYGKEGTEYLVKGRTGDTVAAYYHDQKETLSLSCYPSGQNADPTAIPAIGQTITVTAATDSNLNGTWLVTASSSSRASEKHQEFSITCSRYSAWTPS